MLPKKSITRTIRKAGAHRVSKDASLELVNYLEDSTTKISQKAVRYAKHARRKTVKREDILLALGYDTSHRVSASRGFVMPINPITEEIRKAGAHRVSKDASLELVDQVEIASTKISQKAVRCAKHARRETVKREDIKIAISMLGPGPFG